MAKNRKKSDAPDSDQTLPADQQQTGVAVAELPANGRHELPPQSEPTGEGKKNRPAASFAAHSDRTTCLEVTVWARQVKVSEAEEYTQYALTVSRSWRDKDGKWTPNASYRIHDVPVLLFLIQQAYHFCVNARTEVKIGNEPLPF